jgi:thiol:disulfide interchange protein
VAALAVWSFLTAVGNSQTKGWTMAAVGWALVSLAIIPAAFVSATQNARPVQQGISGAEIWSDGKADRYVAEGHSVFVYFTADWCLTCKANEATAIDRSEVRDAFKQAGVKVLAGDWTNGDPAITRFLEAHGRAGVPFYLWYAPGRSPEELPQLLTAGMLIDRARSAKR